ncbi:hypothetical protein NUW54_g6235 [Trametes sanguinea]|uniref:Uncharacterized protein n=1 Tax=Trametes sanguinea TaxID=158606 RepID=A0ACC1PTZ8_9APHY|nr:hypothetical protein NUW54_g6235 [Trametes sanguinea]
MLIQRAGSGMLPPPGFAPPPWEALAAEWATIPPPTTPTVTLGPCELVLGHDDQEPDDLAVPQLKLAQNPLPSGWSELGCIAEGTSGRALPALTMKDPGMTRAMCASYCGSHGYKLAGVEFSDECYCDNEVKNGASMNFLTWSECSNHCAGNSTFLPHPP